MFEKFDKFDKFDKFEKFVKFVKFEEFVMLEFPSKVVVDAEVGVLPIAETGDIPGIGSAIVLTGEEQFKAQIPTHVKRLIHFDLHACHHFAPYIGTGEVIIVADCIFLPIGIPHAYICQAAVLHRCAKADTDKEKIVLAAFLEPRLNDRIISFHKTTFQERAKGPEGPKAFTS